MGYIKVPRVYEKLKSAEELFAPVIMTAAGGWGKTAAAEYYCRRKKPLLLHCEGGSIREKPVWKDFRGSVVIVEDMQWLWEEEAVGCLRELLHTPGIQVLMLTRGAVPKYLASEEMDLGFVRIQEKDFAFGEKEVKEFFRGRGIQLHPEDAALITEASQGYVRALHCYAARMENGNRYSEDMKAAVWQDIYHLWDSYYDKQYTAEFRHFALCVCRYDEFTQEMAEALTGDESVGRVMEYCYEAMSQLQVKRDGYYSIRPEIRGYYCWKQNLIWSKKEITENYCRAAEYFKRKGNIPDALKYYKKAGEIQCVKELLIYNANTHPGTGHYVETKDYYLEFPREELRKLPVLMAGMSMLYALLLKPDESEKWYHELELFSKDKGNSREQRREARSRLAYLDISLPHRGTKGTLRMMKKVFALIRKEDMVLPELCVTGNMPSLMNGGLDFCEWSKNDIQIARFMGKSVEVILGRYGKGLTTIALAESGFEKGTMPAYEVLTRCGDGFEAAAHEGRIEICFVAVGIQVRQHLIERQLTAARRIAEAFNEKVRQEKAVQLLSNLEAFGVWISLFGGSNADAESYIETVPDARVSFCILDRYRQMIKLRCLISENRLEEAFDLAAFLEGYFFSYERHFYWMENELLKAVILYRMGDEHWKECLSRAVKKASEYHFTRLFAIEGASVLPLLTQMRENGELPDIDDAYVAEIYRECFRVAAGYPDYMRFIPREMIALTNREMQVLSMLCGGMAMDEICSELKISYDGLKKHNRNIYKKLAVKGRAEAERKAARLGLVHRGRMDAAEGTGTPMK